VIKKAQWSQLTPEEKRGFGNGCGPDFFPECLTNLLFGWFFNASCRHHDFNYERGGTEQDRRDADNGLYKAMRLDAERLKSKRLALIAKLFYLLTCLFGWAFFTYGPYIPLSILLQEWRAE